MQQQVHRTLTSEDVPIPVSEFTKYTLDGQSQAIFCRGYLGFTTQQPIITGFQWDTTGGGIVNTGFSNLSVFPA